MTSSPADWTSFYTPEQLSEHDVACGVLAQLLRARQLALLLGAGVSHGLGLPDWKELVQRCAVELDDTSDYSGITSAADLMDAVDRLRRARKLTEADMFQTVRTALYGDLLAGSPAGYGLEVLEHRLLGALGALMMSSARGSAAEVFTLNFDDVLEWYVDLHGFASEVICELPQTLRGDVDVHVYHIHGFLPLVESRYAASSWMVLSKSQLRARLAEDPTFAWEALLLSSVQTKVLLIVGTSMSDTDIQVSLDRARRSGVKRPLGFVLGLHDEDKQAELRENGLVPVSFADHDEIPRFILEICQAASSRS